MRRFIRTWAATSAAIGLGCVASVGGMYAFTRVGLNGRPSGSFEDPNLCGVYLAISIPLVFSAWNFRSRAYRVAQTAVLVLAVLTTASRGAVLATAVMGIMTALFIPSIGARIRAVVVGSAIFVITTQFLSSYLIQHLPVTARLFESTNSFSQDSRVELWTDAIKRWKMSPFVGIGPGQFLGPDRHVVHNTPLNFLVETGIFGFAVFVSLFIWLFVRLYVARGRSARTMVSLVGLFGLCSSMFFLNLQNVPFFWIMIALITRAAIDSRPISPSLDNRYEYAEAT